ncbi:hypothetical protein YB2330_002566 [Saitoella coloradoensis]
MSLSEDLVAFKSEYGPPFTNSIDTSSDSQSSVLIVTLEDQTLAVTLSAAGWTVDRSSDQELRGRTFETPEALLMRASQGFARVWNQRLWDKLEEARVSVRSSFDGEEVDGA